MAGFLGLAILGWGLAVLVGFVPHEDFLVGLGLTAFGACLTVATGLPPLPRIPGWSLALVGAVLTAGILGYVAVRGAPLDLPKATLLCLGFLLVTAAPASLLVVRLPRGHAASAGALAVYALVAIGGPGCIYALQAVFAHTSGTTPVELFLRWGLLAPLAAVVALFGWDPRLDGQMLQYNGVSGPLRVEVGAACSGIQAMALFGVVLGMFLLAQRPRGRSLALWTALGLGGIYAANLLRLVTITAVGHWYGVDALERAHADAGWMFFVAWALAFAYIARRRLGAPRPA